MPIQHKKVLERKIVNRSDSDKGRFTGAMENINLASARLKQSMYEAHLALNTELSHVQKKMLKLLTLQRFKSNELAMTGKTPVLHQPTARKH